MRGKFITFEGIDGSGKSTQLRLLAGDLRMRGLNVLTTLQPGGTPLGRRLRESFLETEENVHPMAELLLFAADRAQHVNFLIKPALEEGKIVISDRYADATVAYQGAGRGFDEKIVAQVIKLATDGLKPDLTLFFDVPIEKAIVRTNSRSDEESKQNRMDRENAAFYGRVREAYLKIAEREPKRFVVIDASGSIDEVHHKVVEVVGEFLS
ncbi:MAG: dTMP kinase [Acidobacteria bacterium]|nr:dTMP kinase [Acidobacteriota bacterium]MBK8812883.1 dTMP kinase [Acidobacteriota bacterium]